MNKPRKKKQHFVPQLHLRYFAGKEPPGMVWTYDAKTERAAPSLPKETAAETNFYSAQNEKGEYLDIIEDWLAGVEGKAAPIYEKLVNGIIPQDQERADFSTFLSSMYARTHAMRRIYSEVHGTGMQFMMDALAANPERFEQEISKYEAERGTISPDIRDGMREWIQDKNNYTVQVDQSAMLRALKVSDNIQPILFDMGWAVLGSEEQHLVTSDNPLVRVTPRETHHPLYGDGGFMNKKAIVTFPLSPSRCLILGWGRDINRGIVYVKRDQSRLYNRQRAYFSERYVYADRFDDGIKRLVHKHRNDGEKMQVGQPGQFAEVKMVRRLDNKD